MRKWRGGVAAMSVVGALLAGAMPAAAVTFDFAAIANEARDTVAPLGQEKTWGAAFPLGYASDGLTVRASGSNSAFSAPWVDAFLDGSDHSGPAGLGVCSTQLGCATHGGGNSSDDNVSAVPGGVETLSLAFDRPVAVTSLLFRNAKHRPVFGTLLIDGLEQAVADGILVGGAAYLGLIESLDFTYGGSAASEFYLSIAEVTPAPVPLPATALLLISGLGALGLVRRRRPA